jgi:hypothetical protein
LLAVSGVPSWLVVLHLVGSEIVALFGGMIAGSLATLWVLFGGTDVEFDSVMGALDRLVDRVMLRLRGGSKS